jgi:hypothetical protein
MTRNDSLTLYPGSPMAEACQKTGLADFGDVSFLRDETLLAEPMSQIRRIYQFVGMDLSPAVEQRKRQWAAENAPEKRATHHYMLHEFGCSEEGIRREVAAYYHRFLP